MQVGTPLKSIDYICCSYIAIRLARYGLKYNPNNPSLCLAKYLYGQNPRPHDALDLDHAKSVSKFTGSG